MSKPQEVVTAGSAPTEPVDGRSGIRYKGGLSLHKRRLSGTWGTWDYDANGKATNGRTIRAKVRKRSPGVEQPVVAKKSPTKGWSEGVELWSHHSVSQPAMGGADE